MGQTAIINGINYSWANLSTVIFGNPIFGFTKIRYSNKQKKENNYGAGSKPISRGYGNYEPEASIDMYLDELRNIISAAPGRDPMRIPPFNIQVLFASINGGEVGQDNLLACEFTQEGLEAAQGETKFIISLPLIIADIQHVS